MSLHVKDPRSSVYRNGLAEHVVFLAQISGNAERSFEHHGSRTCTDAGFKCDPIESFIQERCTSRQHGVAIPYFNFANRAGWTEYLDLGGELLVCRDFRRGPHGFNPGILIGPAFERNGKYRYMLMPEARQNFCD